MSGRARLDAVEAKMGRYLYHGGPDGDAANPLTLKSFLACGLQGSTVYRCVPTVYLTDLAAARCYAGVGYCERPGPVFRVDLHALDGALLRGDEWQLLPDVRYPAFALCECDRQRGVPLDGRFPADGFADPADLRESLDRSGQLAYLGAIPVAAIELADGYGFTAALRAS